MARRFSVNVVLNVLGTVSSALVGFVTLPFLVKQLGSNDYGLWTLAATTTATFAAFDLGIPASAGRLISGKRPQDDVAGISAVMSSALAGVLLLSMVTLGIMLVLRHFFPYMFHVPASRQADVSRALVILGINGVALLISSLFSTLISSYERFDLENALDVFAIVLRAILTFAMVRPNTSITLLAALITSINIMSCVGYVAISFWIEPRLRLRFRYATVTMIRELLSFGLWYFAMVMLRVLVPQIATTAIGIFLNNSAVTTYAIARQLIFYSSALVVAASRTATPRAAMSHFSGRSDLQRVLFIEGGCWTFALSIAICGGFLCLGAPLLDLWQSGRQNAVYAPLVILVLGEFLPISQWISAIVLTGMGLHRGVALLIAAEGLLDAAALPLVTGAAGLMGACLTVSISGLLFRGIGLLYYSCNILNVPVSEYLRRMTSISLMGIASILAVWLFMRLEPGQSVIDFLVGGALYGVLLSVLMMPILLRRSVGSIWKALLDAWRLNVRPRSGARLSP